MSLEISEGMEHNPLPSYIVVAFEMFRKGEYCVLPQRVLPPSHAEYHSLVYYACASAVLFAVSSVLILLSRHVEDPRWLYGSYTALLAVGTFLVIRTAIQAYSASKLLARYYAWQHACEDYIALIQDTDIDHPIELVVSNHSDLPILYSWWRIPIILAFVKKEYRFYKWQTGCWVELFHGKEAVLPPKDLLCKESNYR